MFTIRFQSSPNQQSNAVCNGKGSPEQSGLFLFPVSGKVQCCSGTAPSGLTALFCSNQTTTHWFLHAARISGSGHSASSAPLTLFLLLSSIRLRVQITGATSLNHHLNRLKSVLTSTPSKSIMRPMSSIRSFSGQRNGEGTAKKNCRPQAS